MGRSDCFLVDHNTHVEHATYSRFAFAAGETLYTLQGDPSPIRTRDTIEIGPGAHLDDCYARRINHSFSPNLAVRGRELVAIRDIAAGDEITFNYLANESGIAAPFVCHETGGDVNSSGCRRQDPQSRIPGSTP